MKIKRLGLILLFALLALPACAQRGGLKAWWQALRLRVAVARNVEEKSVQHIVVPEQGTTVLRRAQISNMMGSPIVQVRLPANTVGQGSEILSARIVKPSELRDAVYLPPTKLYVPQAFAEDESAVYKGLRIKLLPELQHILEHGLEIDKTIFFKIHASYELGESYRYMFPPDNNWAEYENLPEITFDLPVVTRIPVTKQMLQENPFEEIYNCEVIFRRDVHPNLISGVMTFLDINGTVDWYQVVLENGKLTLVPAPTTIVLGGISWY